MVRRHLSHRPWRFFTEPKTIKNEITMSNEEMNPALSKGAVTCRFSYDTAGYENAVKWLKEQGKWEHVSTHGQSVDGWSIVETANVLWSQQNGR